MLTLTNIYTIIHTRPPLYFYTAELNLYQPLTELAMRTRYNVNT